MTLFELNPYRLYSENCVLLAADSGSRLVRELKQAGIPAAVIGWAEKGIARSSATVRKQPDIWSVPSRMSF